METIIIPNKESEIVSNLPNLAKIETIRELAKLANEINENAKKKK